MVDSTVGEYPAILQAWHLAGELATHADDAGIPEAPAERTARLAWRAPFSRFVLAESKPGLSISTAPDATTVEMEGVVVTVDDATLVDAVMGRNAGLGDDAQRLLAS